MDCDFVHRLVANGIFRLQVRSLRIVCPERDRVGRDRICGCAYLPANGKVTYVTRRNLDCVIQDFPTGKTHGSDIADQKSLVSHILHTDREVEDTRSNS